MARSPRKPPTDAPPRGEYIDSVTLPSMDALVDLYAKRGVPVPAWLKVPPQPHP